MPTDCRTAMQSALAAEKARHEARMTEIDGITDDEERFDATEKELQHFADNILAIRTAYINCVNGGGNA